MCGDCITASMLHGSSYEPQEPTGEEEDEEGRVVLRALH